MDSITFDIGDYTVQLVDGMALIWRDNDWTRPPDVEIPIARLVDALSTARMLVKADHHA
jgi:hypothetical protein